MFNPKIIVMIKFFAMNLLWYALLIVCCTGVCIGAVVGLVFLINAIVAKANLSSLQRIMLEQLNIGEEVTIHDEKRSYFSYHVIKIGTNKYYPVLKMKEGEVVVDHLLRKYGSYSYERIPGDKYPVLLLQEKAENVSRKI